MKSYPIASDLSFEVFQRRARRFELSAPQLDSRNERLVTMPQHIERHRYLAERDAVEPIWDAPEAMTPLWHVHRKG